MHGSDQTESLAIACPAAAVDGKHAAAVPAAVHAAAALAAAMPAAAVPAAVRAAAVSSFACLG